MNSTQDDPIQIGVFIDGSFWFNLAHYWLHHHSMRTQLAIEGVRDVARWYASEQFQRPVDEVQIDRAHYFQAVSAGAPYRFFRVLKRLGITVHQLSFDPRRNRAVGVKTEFALTCWSETAELRLVMLLTGDDEYRPLVERLVEDDVRVLIPHIDVTFTDSRSKRERWLVTSPHLSDAATDTPSWDDLLDATQAKDYPLASPYIVDDGVKTAQRTPQWR
ncbi:hypothetical protein [Actinomadura sp. 3N407]|uniref:hypothetical protein n=1 Tax=Actinomadura sp. 3N407 TaxID=3457423 RepID=UPI003FCEC38D